MSTPDNDKSKEPVRVPNLIVILAMLTIYSWIFTFIELGGNLPTFQNVIFTIVSTLLTVLLIYAKHKNMKGFSTVDDMGRIALTPVQVILVMVIMATFTVFLVWLTQSR